MTEAERKERKKKYLSITQLARYRNVSTDTLRFYDRIGLFKPAYIDPTNDRRYYSLEQCEQLGTILELRMLEVPIKQIQEFMQNRTIAGSEEILRFQLDILDKEIAEKNKLRDVLRDKLSFLKENRENKVSLDEPILKVFSDRYAVYGKAGEASSKDVALEYMRLEKKISGLSPIFATNKMAMEIPLSVHGNLHCECVRPIIFCAEVKKEEENLAKISGGKYVCMYINDDKGNLEERINLMKQFAYTREIVLAAVGYMIYQVDITLTDKQDETLIELQFPIVESNV